MQSIPAQLPAKQQGFIYSDEADVLNVALFGKTASQWRAENPEKKGNIRDFATIEQLLVMTNLENLNALLIQQGVSQSDRLQSLRTIAVSQLEALTGSKGARDLKKLNENIKK